MGIVYNISLHDALNLPAWQFDIMLDFAHQYQSRQVLDLYQAISLGSWGDKTDRLEYVANLSKSAYPHSADEQPKELMLPTQEELRDRRKKLNGLSIPVLKRPKQDKK